MICSGGAAIADPGIAAQVAEPQHRLDTVGNAAFDPAAQDAPSRVAPEIGFHQSSVRCGRAT